jgi:hypothetical protein
MIDWRHHPSRNRGFWQGEKRAFPHREVMPEMRLHPFKRVLNPEG